MDLLLEFKYLSLKELNLTATQLQNLTMEELAKLPLVVNKLNEATAQAKEYAAALIAHYSLKDLRSFAVVALGFERLVWQIVITN